MAPRRLTLLLLPPSSPSPHGPPPGQQASLDDGWPSFAARSFGPTAPSPLRAKSRFDTHSRHGGPSSGTSSFEMQSGLSQAAGVQAAATVQLEGDLNTLRQERDVLLQEKADLQQDKADQDAGVSSPLPFALSRARALGLAFACTTAHVHYGYVSAGVCCACARPCPLLRAWLASLPEGSRPSLFVACLLDFKYAEHH